MRNQARNLHLVMLSDEHGTATEPRKCTSSATPPDVRQAWRDDCDEPADLAYTWLQVLESEGAFIDGL